MSENEPPVIYTIGHSNHAIEIFTGLLLAAGVDAIADVRLIPYSKRHPQFRKEALARSLKEVGIAYVFLGKELGARPDDPGCFVDGRVSYQRIAETDVFASGLLRVEEGAKRHRIALMCAEREPLNCHRTLLVSRHLILRGAVIRHIHSDGRIENGRDAEGRLAEEMGLGSDDLFLDGGGRIEEAYKLKIS